MPEKPTNESPHVYTVYLHSTFKVQEFREKHCVPVKRDDTVTQIRTTLSLSRILIYVCDHLSWFILFLGYFIFISVNNDDLKWQLLLECNSNPQYPE